MGTFLKHAAFSVVVGIALAIGAWLAWWAGAVALGAGAWDQIPALGLALGVGVVASLAPATIIAVLNRTKSNSVQSQPLDATKAENEKPQDVERTDKKPRRHRPEDNPLHARVTPALRWHSMSKELATLLRGSRVGEPIVQRLHPEDVPAVDQAFTHASAGGKTQQALCRFMIADTPAPAKKHRKSDTSVLPPLTPDSFVYVRINVSAKRNRTGKVVGFLCRFVDMTPLILQKELELQIARKMVSRAKRRLRSLANDMDRLKLSYRELYQQAPVMYFSLDRDGRFVTFNDTLLATLGYDRPDLQGKNYTLLLGPATLRSYVSIAENMPSQPGELETTWHKKDGTQFDVWLHTVPVFDETGRFVRYRNAAIDLSEKNRLSNELRARGDELERTNHQLRTINSELEAFTHVVSHDLKEPLRTLQAYSHLLAEEHAAQLGPDGFQYVNHLIRASRRLGTLIDELLNLSQAGRITHAPQAFNLNAIVATVRQDLVDLIQRKEAIVLTEGSLPDVVGDPVRITQLLTNLVANGLKYNQNPAPKVVVGVAANQNEPGRAVIFVRDNGIGIDAAFHEQIFGIFRRLHQGDEFEGTGAGLAICKKIVEGHGGRIWVESQLAAGATFFFTLPRSPLTPPINGQSPAEPAKSADAPASGWQRRTAVKTGSDNGRAPRLVVVDDQADVGLIIRKLGERDGLSITWFPTAEEAWDFLQRHGADLLLLDVHLTGISGVELCRRIRTLPHLAETPVAMFTPDQDAQNVQLLRDAGADFFLTKDLLCEPAAWQQKIKGLLEQLRAAPTH